MEDSGDTRSLRSRTDVTLTSPIAMRDVSVTPFLNVRFRSYSEQLRTSAIEETACLRYPPWRV